MFAGVEPGGVHVTDDNGQTWEECRGGVHDDIHNLRCSAQDELVAYFRAAFVHGDTLYTSAACVPPTRWDSNDADPVLLTASASESLTPVESPHPYEGREWDEVWTAGEGATPDADRLARGTAAYLLLVVCPLTVDLALLAQ
ncbi:hypothetical protein [Halobacterium salinarum]|uniref:hypothetical protein n=1 Tax=Halobacterium salinarum TaxID=2242 RepID=UPI002552A5A9|nr:hypothetical protein [Halobacterium salinarum]MDL0129238.1 hypothetical protein [Halobacterium salinarum]MDL0134213.1 hypothetical protein [Halobacterium salinarum]